MDFLYIEMLMKSYAAVHDDPASDTVPPGFSRGKTEDPPFEDRIDIVARHLWTFCQPLLDYFGAGSKPPAGDTISIMLDCLADAEQISPGSMGRWRIAAGRVTTAQSSKALYKKGQWLQSEDGRIIDFNRPDLEEGYRVTQADHRPIAEYRSETGTPRIKVSPLLPIWRGECAGPAGFADKTEMRKAYCRLRLSIASALADT